MQCMRPIHTSVVVLQQAAPDLRNTTCPPNRTWFLRDSCTASRLHEELARNQIRFDERGIPARRSNSLLFLGELQHITSTSRLSSRLSCLTVSLLSTPIPAKLRHEGRMRMNEGGGWRCARVHCAMSHQPCTAAPPDPRRVAIASRAGSSANGVDPRKPGVTHHDAAQEWRSLESEARQV